MKNKGRIHIKGLGHGAHNNSGGMICHITRPIRSMSGNGMALGRFDKKKWVKRMRGYLKSQTKNEQ